MIEIKLPEEEAWALYAFLAKVEYDRMCKACRREPGLPDGRTIEDVAWCARSLVMGQIKQAVTGF